MTGEELNWKYHESMGWKLPEGLEGMAIAPDGGLWSGLPRLHDNANLAIAEATKVLGIGFWMECLGDLGWCCGTADGVHHARSGHFDGHTPCEAILKALIAAKQRASKS